MKLKAWNECTEGSNQGYESGNLKPIKHAKRLQIWCTQQLRRKDRNALILMIAGNYEGHKDRCCRKYLWKEEGTKRQRNLVWWNEDVSAALNEKQLFKIWLKNKTRESRKNLRRVNTKQLANKVVSLAMEHKLGELGNDLNNNKNPLKIIGYWKENVKFRDKLSCVELRQRLGLEVIAKVVQRNRLGWYGHVWIGWKSVLL